MSVLRTVERKIRTRGGSRGPNNIMDCLAKPIVYWYICQDMRFEKFEALRKQIRAQGIIPFTVACHQVRDPSSNRILAYECHLNLSRDSARTKFKGPCPSYVRVSHGFRRALQQQWRENKRLRRGHRIPGRYKVNNKL